MSNPRNTAQRNRLRARAKATRAACHICGAPIDYDLASDDPLSFQLDHVIPLAKGGTDTVSNTAPSHKQCNSKKRARIIAPIVRRSGSLQ